MFVTCACILVGYRCVQGNQIVITISSFTQGPPCKEITWLHDKPTCPVFFCMLFYVFPLSPFSSSSFCRLRAYLLVVTRSAFLIILLPLSRKLLENAPPRKIRFRSAGFWLLILISQDRGILIFLNDSECAQHVLLFATQSQSPPITTNHLQSPPITLQSPPN